MGKIKINNQNIFEYAVIFSGFFLLGINRYLSPVYFVFLFLLFFTLIYLHKISKKSLLFFCLTTIPTTLIIIGQNFTYDLKHGVINEIGRHIVPLLYTSLLLSLSEKYDTNNLERLAHRFIKFNVYLLSFEGFFRIVKSVLSGAGGSFYDYKGNSILFPDSNFVGLQIVGLYLFIELFFKKNIYTKYKIVLLILLFLTFSRTAYLILLPFLIWNLWKKIHLLFKILITAVGGAGFVIALIKIYNDITEDGSFKTKVEIYEKFIELFIDDLNSTTFFLGIGSGNIIYSINRASHNIFGLTFEMGILWLIIFIGAFFYLGNLSGKKGLLYVFIIMISGIVSLLPITYMTFHYTILVLLYLNHKKCNFQY